MSIINVDQFQVPFIMRKSGYKIQKPDLDNVFRKTQLPYVGEMDLGPYVTDADLRKLERGMIKDTRPHRHKSFWLDNSAQSFAYLTIAVLVGEGINVTIDVDNKAENIVNEWNDEINVKHESIEDFISTVWIDNLIDAQTLWRVFIDEDDPDHLVDIQRVSMQNIKIEEHLTRGWRRFIQRANLPKEHINKMKFYRRDTLRFIETEYVETIIPDEPNCCLYINFFKSPPVSSVLHLMVYKRWITWFMRKFAEKYWAPFLIGYIGDPKSGMMPARKKEQDDSIATTLNVLKRIRDFGVGAFLGHTRIEALDTKSAKNSDLYVKYLEYLNKEIVLGLLGSMALREDSSTGKATTDVVQQGYLRFIRGKRNAIGTYLRKFYSQVLLPAHGINGVKATDVKVDWPPLRLENIKEVLQAVEIGAKIGAFRDAKEIRRILTPIWKHIDEKISDKEAKEMKNLFMEINSPSRAEGDAPQQRASGSKAKPAK